MQLSTGSIAKKSQTFLKILSKGIIYFEISPQNMQRIVRFLRLSTSNHHPIHQGQNTSLVGIILSLFLSITRRQNNGRRNGPKNNRKTAKTVSSERKRQRA